MIGRGIRIHPNKETAYIIDLCENYKRFGKVEDLTIDKTGNDLWFIRGEKRQLTNVYYD